jgi:hypothetical protein
MRNRIGDYIWEATPEEVAEVEAANAQAEREYWQNVDYKTAVANEVHKKYTIDDEMGLHRQRYDKPEEFAIYNEYVEHCKAYVKEKKHQYAEEPVNN